MPEDRTSIRQAAADYVLRHFYDLTNRDAELYSGDVCEATGVDHEEFRRHVFEELLEQGLIDELRCGCDAGERGFQIWLSPRGLLNAEHRDLVSPARRAEHEQARAAVLRHLRTVHDQHGPAGEDRDLEIEAHLDQTGVGGWAIAVLHTQGLIEGDHGYYRITAAGLEWLAESEKLESRLARLAVVEGYPPRQRGKALEGVIAEALRAQGCTCVEDTGAAGEQIDQVVQCGPCFFVCETKWERSPIQGGIVSQMAGRMLRRAASFIGVIFSMSGFTDGARQTASTLANHRVIVLFGPEDVRGMIRDEKGFLDVVEQQQLGLAMRARLPE